MNLNCTIDLVGTNNQVRDGYTIVENEDWSTIGILLLAGNATVKLRHAEVPVYRDARVGSALNSAHSGGDGEDLTRSQGRGESGEGQLSELHGERSLDCLETGEMDFAWRA
jgi:hypothetical protein